MQVYKFGGASVNSVERIQNLGKILQNKTDNEPLMVIISAMGKTTNALEKVAEVFFSGDTDNALRLFEVIKQQHLTTAKFLLVTHYNACYTLLNDFFTEIEWLLHDKPVREFDYYYDQIVCIGELLSTAIVSFYFNEIGVANTWLDVRDIVRTDNNFRDAIIDWAKTKTAVSSLNFATDNIFLTQGFIGATDDNESTTLGREGSDFTAAIFANLLNASSLTIWKDVAGVMNVDPKQFPDAELIPELSFEEVIEMAYYGAQVIHPKTIKPLQNKGIPLHVKCFLDINLPGTTIGQKLVKHLPPIIVVKNQQALLTLHSQDFSFVGEQPMIELYKIFSQLKIKANVIQTEAISLQICLDDRKEKIEQLALAASTLFDIQVTKNLTLLTIRHYNEAILEQLTAGKQILLLQKTPETVQVLYG
ncbi:MAG: aspartate kinase [Flavobacterium sp.]|nr:aspartate kinase [Flavobacterium sp.]